MYPQPPKLALSHMIAVGSWFGVGLQSPLMTYAGHAVPECRAQLCSSWIYLDPKSTCTIMALMAATMGSGTLSYILLGGLGKARA